MFVCIRTDTAHPTFKMQSIRIVRRKYEGYTANPSRDEKQEAKRHSADSQAQTLNNLDDEEKGKKEEEIRKKRKEADPYYVTWEGDDDPMNPQNWSTIKVCLSCRNELGCVGTG